MNSHNLRLRALIGTALLALSLMAVGATGAQAAKTVKITGGTTTLTPSAGTVQFLSNHGVSVAALSPATLSNGVVTLPVAGGRVNPSNLRGYVTHSGGLKFTKGNRSLALRHITLVSTKQGAFIYATTPVRRCRTAGFRARRIPVRICLLRTEAVRVARLSNVVRNGKTVTATVLLSQTAADFINRVAGSHVVSAGANLGTEKTTVTTA